MSRSCSPLNDVFSDRHAGSQEHETDFQIELVVLTERGIFCLRARHLISSQECVRKHCLDIEEGKYDAEYA